MTNADPDLAKRTIPAEIRRVVRQRCGFGCVVCGLPLYEYEHMAGWAEARVHEADEITLLCDRHHREKTGGLLPIAAVRAANADPYNRRAGVSSPYTLHYSGDRCDALIGSNRLAASTGGDFAAVLIDGVPLIAFRFEDDHYLLNLLLFDEANELVLRIADNELMYSAQPWDIELVSTRLVIRAAARDIFIDMNFQPPGGIEIARGRLLYNGIELYIRPEFVLVTNNATLLSGNGASGSAVALNVGVDQQGIPSAFRIAGVPRYGYDRAEALRWAREQVGAAAMRGLMDDAADGEPPS